MNVIRLKKYDRNALEKAINKWMWIFFFKDTLKADSGYIERMIYIR